LNVERRTLNAERDPHEPKVFADILISFNVRCSTFDVRRSDRKIP